VTPTLHHGAARGDAAKAGVGAGDRIAAERRRKRRHRHDGADRGDAGVDRSEGGDAGAALRRGRGLPGAPERNGDFSIWRLQPNVAHQML
jgi:hypothetical protein